MVGLGHLEYEASGRTAGGLGLQELGKFERGTGAEVTFPLTSIHHCFCMMWLQRRMINFASLRCCRYDWRRNAQAPSSRN
jgi:hypothetical protein